MSFAEQVAADCVAMATPDEFGEEVTYRPDGVTPFAVLALAIGRTPLLPNPAAGKQTGQNTFELVLPKGSDGVATVTKGSDKVDVPPTRGAAAVTMRVIDILGEGLGSWRLKVRG